MRVQGDVQNLPGEVVPSEGVRAGRQLPGCAQRRHADANAGLCIIIIIICKAQSNLLLPDRRNGQHGSMLLPSDGHSAVLQATDGTWQLQLSIPAALAPLTLAYVVHVPDGGNGGNGTGSGVGQTIAPRTGSTFCVPVGMRPGSPDPLGERCFDVPRSRLAARWC